MKLNLIFIILALIFSSCTTQRRCAKLYPCQAGKDSVYIETLRDVPVYIKGDSIVIDVPVPCPDLQADTESANLKQTIQILQGRLRAVATMKPRIDTVKVVETVTETVYHPQVVEKFKTPRYMKWLSLFGIIALIYIGVGLYFKFKDKH